MPTTRLNHEDFARARAHRHLLCSCPGPRDDDECPTCHRPRISPDREAALRADPRYPELAR
jgi:hypothetical protein